MLKMGKTERNGVDPQELIDRYGADTARLFVMFASPPEQTLDWNDAGVEGANRFLKRLWKFAAQAGRARWARSQGTPATGTVGAAPRGAHRAASGQLRLRAHAIQHGRVRRDEAAQRAGSARATRRRRSRREGFGVLLRVLYPACPHTTWRLWGELGYDDEVGPLLDAPWPAVDERALVQDEIELMLQINGKLRGSISVPATAGKAAIEAAALATPEVGALRRGRPGEAGDRRAGPPRQRRALMRARRGFVLACAAAALAGCGFQLQRPPDLRFKTIQLTGFPARSPLAAELKRNIDASTTTKVVEALKDAEVVLQALADEREKSVVVTTAADQVRQYELRSRFRFQLRTASGKELVPASEILLKRQMTYTESAALAKEQEEAFLYRSMQSDLVSQVLRRLASVQVL